MNITHFQQISGNYILVQHIQQITLSNSTKSQPYLQYPSAYKKTRALHFNTGRDRERPLGAGALNGSKRDTTVWFGRGLKGSSSAILLNISHIAYIINGDYC